MTPSLLYMARAGLYLALFYAFFLLVMRRSSLFGFNRAALLLGTLLCHLLPAIRLRTVILPAALPLTGAAETADLTASVPPAPAFPWLTLLYLGGLGIVFALFAVSAFRTFRMIGQGTEVPCDGCRLVLTGGKVPSFSWGRMVVMSRDDYERYPAILAHERQHILRHHTWDLLLMSVVAAFHWYNPLVWIARAELKLLHEYEADAGLLRQGIDATQYQLLLVRKAVGDRRFSLANGFDHARLKQRISMMQRKPSPGWMRLAYAALLPLFAGTMFLCNPARAEIRSDAVSETVLPTLDDQDHYFVLLDGKRMTGRLEDLDVSSIESVTVLKSPDSIAKYTSEDVQGVLIITTMPSKLGVIAVGEVSESVPYGEVGKKPTFQGQDAALFAKWLAQNLTYPAEAKKAGIQGQVLVGFDIGADGSVRNVKVLRGVHELLDAEAVRVVSASPRWEPGISGGKPVQVSYSFPLMFRLK